jgi:hypothetical protein
MSIQAHREAEFKWRPSDDSVATTHKYDREAEKWYLSFKAAERKHRPRNIKEDLRVIGAVLTLVFSLLWLVSLVMVKFFKWMSK